MELLASVKERIDQARGTDLEKKVKLATSPESWHATGTLKTEIANATFDYAGYREIMPLVWQRINLPSKNWTVILKALTLLDHLVRHGSQKVIDDCRDHMSVVRSLQEFSHHDDDGRERGSSIRTMAKELSDLLNDDEELRKIRAEAQKNRDKYVGLSSDGSGGSTGYGNSHYLASYDQGVQSSGAYGQYSDEAPRRAPPSPARTKPASSKKTKAAKKKAPKKPKDEEEQDEEEEKEEKEEEEVEEEEEPEPVEEDQDVKKEKVKPSIKLPKPIIKMRKPAIKTASKQALKGSQDEEEFSPPPEEPEDEPEPVVKPKDRSKSGGTKKVVKKKIHSPAKTGGGLFDDDWIGGSPSVPQVTKQLGEVEFNPRAGEDDGKDDDEEEWEPFAAPPQPSVPVKTAPIQAPIPSLYQPQPVVPQKPTRTIMHNVFEMGDDDDGFTEFQTAPTPAPAPIKQDVKGSTASRPVATAIAPTPVPPKKPDSAWDTHLVDLDLGKSTKKPAQPGISLSSRAATSHPSTSFSELPSFGFDPVPTLTTGFPNAPPTVFPGASPGFPGAPSYPTGGPSYPTGAPSYPYPHAPAYPQYPGYPGYPSYPPQQYMPPSYSGYPPSMPPGFPSKSKSII